MQARPLQSSDVFVAMRLASGMRAQLEALFSQEGMDANKLGGEILFDLLARADTEIKPWLADMAQLPVDEFDRLPVGQLMDLIESIVKQEDWPAFLARITGLLKSATPAKSTSLTSFQPVTAGKTTSRSRSRSAAL